MKSNQKPTKKSVNGQKDYRTGVPKKIIEEINKLCKQTNKTKYIGRKNALGAASHNKKRFPDAVYHVYRCKFCGEYHLTTQEQRRKEDGENRV